MGQSAPRRGSQGVLIVDDDAVCRRSLQAIVGAARGVHVVGTVRDIASARRAIEQGGVSILTLDVVLRGESGLDLLRWINAEHRDLRVILVTGGGDSAARTEVDAIFLGAAALVRKPDATNDVHAFERTLNRTIDALLASQVARQTLPPPATPVAPPAAAYREVVAVGASTGGPPVVLALLKGLRPSFDVPILLAQHMPRAHMGYYVDMLAASAGRPVSAGRNGAPVQRGHVYVAPGGLHMRVARAGRRLELRLDDGPEEHYCRPAVDPLFRSIAAACGPSAIGVVATGMGCDGAAGALSLRDAGAPVMVQDRQSSVVWGMPGAVVKARAASAEVPAAELADVVMRWTLDGRGAHDGSS